jgi:hypothetical protein
MNGMVIDNKLYIPNDKEAFDMLYNKIMKGEYSNEQIETARNTLISCYDKMIDLMKYYIVMKEEYYHLVVTWIIGTYYHEQFYAYPYLFFNAMRGSAKTRTLKLISNLGAKGNGAVQNNISESALFRIERGTTTCIDEIESIGSKDKQMLRELLNSAYKKGMQVVRMKKMKVQGSEQFVRDVHEPYFPIALANIWGMDEVVQDRSITLILEKSNELIYTMKMEDFDINPIFSELKRTLETISPIYVDNVCRCSKKNIYTEWNSYLHSTLSTLSTLDTSDTYNDKELIPFFDKLYASGIGGRNFELFLPLFLITKSLSDFHFERMLKIAKDMVDTKKDDEYAESKDVSLYDFVSKNIEHDKSCALKELTNHFRLFIGDTDMEDKWINERWMSRALKRLNLVTDKKRISSGWEFKLNINKAKDKLRIFIKEGKDANN